MNGTAFYEASSEFALFRLPHELAPPEFVRVTVGAATTDGKSIVLTERGEAPVAVPAGPQ